MPKIKLIIADDHPMFGTGLKSLLESDSDLEVVAIAEDGQMLLKLLDEHYCDVVLLDLNMPNVSGLEVLEQFNGRSLPKFIVLSMHMEGQYVAQAVRFGAMGYLAKNAKMDELKKAILAVMNGDKYFNREITEVLINNMAVEQPKRQDISSREQQVLQLVANGRTTKEIAEELVVSVRTIETHRVNLMKKLKVANTAELIKVAAQLSII